MAKPTNNDPQQPLKKEEINRHPDEKIDQDFPGFPHNPASKDLINPDSEQDAHAAGLSEKDGEKMTDKEKKEPRDDGSAGAFDAAERVRE